MFLVPKTARQRFTTDLRPLINEDGPCEMYRRVMPDQGHSPRLLSGTKIEPFV
jgi:hypothetical protein